MNIFLPIPAIARGGVQVLRIAVKAIGRRFWRALNCWWLAAIGGQQGNVIGLGSGVTVVNPRLIRYGPGVTIGDQAELLVEPSDHPSGISIELGQNAKIGKRCQLAANPGLIRIGAHASLHSNVVLLGHVSIGRYTLLSANIFASSGNHRAFDAPDLLIRDQDLKATREGRPMKPVVVEEDCWIGWGAAIMSGVHIGRGAIVGANSVVTRDVEPYAVVAGQPAREIKRRLQFSPGPEIIAACQEHGPYLYRGFLQSLDERQAAPKNWLGHVGALAETVIVLSGEPRYTRLRLRGITLAPEVSLRIRSEDREALLRLPANVGMAFDEELLLADLRAAVEEFDEPNPRLPSARVFCMSARFLRPRAAPVSDLSPVWALQSAALLP
jgi:acetyltransferase-like isoleucine patch superfamily enzyme